MTFVTILAAILCFGVIILIHEAGHFFVAKKCGIRVLEFAIGMGPAIFSKKIGETKYSLRLFPVGGFCAMEGEDENSDDPRAFRKQKVWKRMLVTVAGAVMNLILGFFLIILTANLDTALTTTTIADFHATQDGSFCATSNQQLQVDDVFYRINGLRIYTVADISYALQNHDGDTYEVVVLRNGQQTTLHDVKFLDTYTQGVIDFYVYGQKKSFGAVMKYSGRNFLSTARLIWISFIDLVRGRYGFRDLSGVVGIIDVTTETVAMQKTFREKCMALFDLMSFITINVGIFNLIPFPALDGGRLFFLCIEAIRRKPVSATVEASIHFIGLALLMLLMVAITFQDVFKIFNK